MPYTQYSVSGGLSTAWASYALTVKAERLPYHNPRSCYAEREYNAAASAWLACADSAAQGW